jgi:tetratricopeptide (TPR) repeat protein
MSSWLRFASALLLIFAGCLLQGLGQSQSSTAPDHQDSSSASNSAASKQTPGDASSSSADSSHSQHAPNLTPPRSDRVQVDDLGPALGDSSSKDTEVDLAAPTDDAKNHPKSSSAVADAEAGMSPGGISEFHSWDPHQASKEVEVGDFYYKRGNYRAAESRYREALSYKQNDAVATFRLAQCLEKLGLLDDARSEYESYLKILPHGPEAERAEKIIERLKTQDPGAQPR